MRRESDLKKRKHGRFQPCFSNLRESRHQSVSILLLRFCYHFLKDRRMLFCQLRQHFAVDGDVGCFQEGDKAGVGQAKLANCGVDLDRPQVTERALLGATIAEGVDASFEHGRACKTDLALSSPLVAFYACKKILAAFCVLCTSFDAWHIRLGKVIGKHRLQCAANGDAKGDVGALVACGVARFAGIEVALPRFSLEHLAGSCDTNAFR